MEQAIEVYEGMGGDIQIARPPEVVLEEARKAAKVLNDVLQKKEKKVMMNGEQYLEFEDWQTVARFYGVTAKIKETEFLDYGGVKGFLAKAVAVRSDGMEISAAEAMCMNDEDKWSTRAKYEYVNGQKTKTGDVAVPLFQLRSMAQTRACSKVLRNVLAWVVVLAGYKPTPAEEMTGDEFGGKTNKPPLTPPARKSEAAKPETKPENQTVIVGVTEVSEKTGQKKNGDPYTIYTIMGTDGNKYGTLSDTFGKLAFEAWELFSEVEITFTDGKFGRNITNLVAVPKQASNE